MLMRIDTARYILAVMERATTLPRDARTLRCPECNEDVTENVLNPDDPHIIGTYGDPSTEGATDFLIVACEGYWIIDPALVGMPRDTWQDWRQLPDDTTPDDFGA